MSSKKTEHVPAHRENRIALYKEDEKGHQSKTCCTKSADRVIATRFDGEIVIRPEPST